jgi:hypothetical protein
VYISTRSRTHEKASKIALDYLTMKTPPIILSPEKSQAPSLQFPPPTSDHDAHHKAARETQDRSAKPQCQRQ